MSRNLALLTRVRVTTFSKILCSPEAKSNLEESGIIIRQLLGDGIDFEIRAYKFYDISQQTYKFYCHYQSQSKFA